MKYITAILLLCFAACNHQHNDEAGGPCSYRYDTLTAVVMKIPAIDSNSYDLVMLLHNKTLQPLNDSIRYSQERHHLLTAQEIADQNIQLNDTFELIKGTMITGSCNPNYRILLPRRQGVKKLSP